MTSGCARCFPTRHRTRSGCSKIVAGRSSPRVGHAQCSCCIAHSAQKRIAIDIAVPAPFRPKILHLIPLESQSELHLGQMKEHQPPFPHMRDCNGALEDQREEEAFQTRRTDEIVQPTILPLRARPKAIHAKSNMTALLKNGAHVPFPKLRQRFTV